jgi:hypothetical protein
VRGISREALARDTAWALADGACKDLTTTWSTWEQRYAAAITTAARAATLAEPRSICDRCPISAECADLAQLSGYTGIAGGRAFRNGRPDTFRAARASRVKRSA